MVRPRRKAKQMLSVFVSGRLSYLLKLGKIHQQFRLSEIKQPITQIRTGCSQFYLLRVASRPVETHLYT